MIYLLAIESQQNYDMAISEGKFIVLIKCVDFYKFRHQKILKRRQKIQKKIEINLRTNAEQEIMFSVFVCRFLREFDGIYNPRSPPYSSFQK